MEQDDHMCADSIVGGSNDDEIYAEEVVEDGGGSELVLVPRREVRVFEIMAWRDHHRCVYPR